MTKSSHEKVLVLALIKHEGGHSACNVFGVRNGLHTTHLVLNLYLTHNYPGIGPQAYFVYSEPEDVLASKSIVFLRIDHLETFLANIGTRLLNYIRHCFELIKLLVD